MTSLLEDWLDGCQVDEGWGEDKSAGDVVWLRKDERSSETELLLKGGGP